MSERLVSPIAFKPLYHQLRARLPDKPEAAKGLLSLANIDRTSLADIKPSISYQRYYQAWQYCESITEDPLIGLHIGERMHPSSLGLLGYAIMNCRNILDALKLTISVNPYQNETVRNDVRIEDDLVFIELNSTYPSKLVRPWVEMCISAYLTLFHVITNNQYRGREKNRSYSYIEVGFKHKPAGSEEEYQRVLNSKVKFEQATNYAIFELRLGKLPIFMADQGVLNKLLSELNIKKVDSHSSTSAVRNYLSGKLADGIPNQSQVANAMGVSRSTLIRRLKDEKTTFGFICESLRKDIAIELLLNTNLPIGEIGLQVGFSNSSAFYRAFKSWTRVTPKGYRKNYTKK